MFKTITFAETQPKFNWLKLRPQRTVHRHGTNTTTTKWVSYTATQQTSTQITFVIKGGKQQQKPPPCCSITLPVHIHYLHSNIYRHTSEPVTSAAHRVNLKTRRNFAPGPYSFLLRIFQLWTFANRSHTRCHRPVAGILSSGGAISSGSTREPCIASEEPLGT